MKKTIQYRPIPQKVKLIIKKMESIEVKEKELLTTYNDIISTAPYCQHPPIARETLDNAIKLNKQRATLWNEIRGFVVNSNYETLWQLAIKTKGMATKRWGKETLLDFSTNQIKELWGMKD